MPSASNFSGRQIKIPYYGQSMKSISPYYKILDHTADLGVKVKGKDLPTLFRNAGYALLDVLVSGKSPEIAKSMNLAITGTDLPDLMVRWLGEILYLFEGEGLISTLINIHSLSNNNLEASLHTLAFDPKFHQVHTEVKAVTYHRIEVVQKGGIWEASIIFDL